MRLLIDTHVLIWWAEADPRLTPVARASLTDASNELFVSSVSAMEVATKVAIGKLSLQEAPEIVIGRLMSALSAREMPLTFRHALQVAKLPLHHRDPFDRLLVATAITEGLTLLTADPLVRTYAVPTLW